MRLSIQQHAPARKSPRRLFTNAFLCCGASLLLTLSALPLLVLRIASARAAGEETDARARQPLEAARRDMEEAARFRGEWKESALRQAIEKYLLAERGFRAAGSEREEAAARVGAGEVYLLLGEHRAAAAHFGRALELYRTAGDRRGEAETLNAVGSVSTFVGENEKAIALFEAALRIGREIDDRATIGRALGRLGEAFYNLSDMGRALDFLQQSLRVFETVEDPRGRAQTLRYLGYAHTDLSELPQALDYFKQSLPFWQAVGDLRGEAQSINAIGLINSLLGEREQAIEFYGRAERLFREMGDREGLTTALNGQGEVYANFSLERALVCHEEALRLSQQTGELEGQITSHRYLGNTHRALGDAGGADEARPHFERALEHYQQSLALGGVMRDRRIEAYNLEDIGSVHDALGDLDRALGYYLRALRLSREVKNPRGESQVLNSIGYVYERRGRGPEALAFYRQALPLTRAAEDHAREAYTLYNIARAERGGGDLAAAATHVEEARRIVESLRTKVPGHAFRSSYFASVQKYFELEIDILMRRHAQQPAAGFDLRALEASELARARSLLDMLGESRAAIRNGVSPELAGEGHRLQQLINVKANRQMALLSRPHTAEQAAAAEQEMAELSARYEEVEAQIRRQSPRYAALMQPRPLNIGDIQSRVLDDRTVLLEYALGDERSYVWTVTRDAVAAYELPGRARIEEAARRLYGLLTAHQPAADETAEARRARLAQADADYWREADALSDLILGPAAEHLAGRRLLVVADGALQYIPFGALTMPAPGGTSDGDAPQTDAGARPDGGARPPLFTRHEVVSLPSASILPALQGESAGRAPAERAVAVFADPVYERDDPRVRAPVGDGAAQDEAPFERVGAERATRDVDALFGNLGVPRLPASREEANAIAALLPASEVSKVTDFGASRAAVLEPGLARYRVIHFATHSILHRERPELSGIVLSLFDERGATQDGFLRLHDIYNLNLPADLVVLSACNTGLGKDVRGEGLIGLTRGFMYAGAGSVVASLWKVDDEATAELMKHFYEAMFRRGLTPPAALREAQLALWRQRRWRAPYFWAGFVIQGQYTGLRGMAVASPARSAWRLAAWAAAAAALSCAALYAVGRRRRKVRAAPGRARP